MLLEGKYAVAYGDGGRSAGAVARAFASEEAVARRGRRLRGGRGIRSAGRHDGSDRPPHMRLARRLAAAVAGTIAASLGGSAAATEAPRTTPADLRINEIQVLGTHNSYHVEPPPDVLDVYIDADPDSINLAYTHAPLTTQLEEQGIRQFELDLVADPEGDLFRPIGAPGWKVLHIEQVDERSTCETLVACLEEFKRGPTNIPTTCRSRCWSSSRSVVRYPAVSTLHRSRRHCCSTSTTRSGRCSVPNG